MQTAYPQQARRKRRGFTLLEVMVAVMIVGILAAVSLPGMAEQLRNRRTQELAQNVAMFYRDARARAAGRGAAQMVSFSTQTLPQGQWQLFEAVQPLVAQPNTPTIGTCGNLPTALSNSCLTTAWALNAPDTRLVATLGAAGSVYAEVFSQFIDVGAAQAQADICYTPAGRSYLRLNGGPFVPLARVPSIRVIRQKAGNPIGFAREVLLPANGVARLSDRRLLANGQPMP